jgi:hypothetical protein
MRACLFVIKKLAEFKGSFTSVMVLVGLPCFSFYKKKLVDLLKSTIHLKEVFFE